MKNRKRIVVAFLICAMLLLGVGFAAINGELVIKGELGSALQKSDVVFTNVNVQWTDHNTNDGSTVTTSVERTPVATSGSDVALGGDSGLTTVSISATGLSETADVAVFTFTIENFGEETISHAAYATENAFCIMASGLARIIFEVASPRYFGRSE